MLFCSPGQAIYLISTYLLDKGYEQLSNANKDLPSKCNDMELFHAAIYIPRPKALQLDLNGNPRVHQSLDLKYPFKDGYDFLLQGGFLKVFKSLILCKN